MASLKVGPGMHLSARTRCFTSTGPAPRVLLLGASGLVQRPAVVRRADGDKASSSTPTEKVSSSKEEDLPPWIRRERERELAAANPNKDPVPWPAYLLLSIIVAIAAVGSIFEWIDKNPVFGVVPVDSPLWAPILFFFAGTGLPLSGYCFYKGVTIFNEEAELQDKIDGYM